MAVFRGRQCGLTGPTLGVRMRIGSGESGCTAAAATAQPVSVLAIQASNGRLATKPGPQVCAGRAGAGGPDGGVLEDHPL